VAEISLQGSGVVPLIGERIAACMAQHVRMSLETKTRLAPSALDHAGEPCGAEGCSSLRREHEGRLRLLLALKAPEGSYFIAKDRMGAWRSPLEPTNMQRSRSEVDLIPSESTSSAGRKPWR
jgi:hypothetical protein